MIALAARLLSLLVAVLALPAFASGAPLCPGNPDALGTSRVLAVDAATIPRVGRKQFPQTLPLAPKEVVLTFDDGPWPGTTERVLEALRRECVRANFFLIGRNAQAHAALARRELAEGHVIGYHTFAHPILNRLSTMAAELEIDHGFAAVDTALFGSAARAPVTPFFRFPGFASTPPLLDWLEHRRIAVFGADLWASDWDRMSPAQELGLVLARLEETRGGILLLHDTKSQTAAMLPQLLRELKTRGFSLVQAVSAPAGAVGAASTK